MENKCVPVVVGVDVGGTNTDAVVIAKDQERPVVLAAVKEPTTSDVTTGVKDAIFSALKSTHDNGQKVAVVQVNIGTTHFVNAAVQGKGLAKVGVIRLCGSVSHALPPFSDFPKRLADIISGSVHMLKGGYRYDGRIIDEIDENEIKEVVQILKAKAIACIVLSGIFSPIRPDQECQVKDIILREYPEASLTLSNEIGHIGLLERENAAILNECLKPLCQITINGFQAALKDLGLKCPLYLTQNDGTIMSADTALDYPIYTFASGPTNSMRGAAYLSELKNAIVVDIGGTTTDVGMLKNGFPREASTQVKVGGARTNFRMPDVLSIGLGGGSYVEPCYNDDKTVKHVSVGPLSAGYNLQNEAFIFSSRDNRSLRNLTASDIAVAAGMASLGDPTSVGDLSKELVKSAIDRIHQMVEEAIDKIKLSNEELPVILVGGGSILIDPKRHIAGAKSVILPENFGVANAIGAALSQVSGRVDYVCSLLDMVDCDAMEKKIEEAVKAVTDDPDGKETEIARENAQKPFFVNARDKATEEACEKAKAATIKSGADPSSMTISEKEYSTLSYIPGQAIRIKITAVGNLADWKKTGTPYEAWTPNVSIRKQKSDVKLTKQGTTSMGNKLSSSADLEDATQKPSEPYIDPATGEWILSLWDIECIVVGAGIFGCGGGGSPHIGRLRSLEAVRKGKKIRIISPERLLRNADPDKDLVVVVAFMGAPLIMYEQLVSSVETTGALKAMEELYNIGGYEDGKLKNTEGVEVKSRAGMTFIEDYQPQTDKSTTTGNIGGKKIIALMSAEIGGMNAIEPFLVGADLDIPIIDADGMGRAFPEVQMFCPYMYGVSPYPATLVDDRNRRAVMLQTPSAKHLEHHFRDTVVEMGCSGGLVLSALRKHEVYTKTILYSVSHAWRLGNAILRARLEKISPIDAILAEENSKHIMTGKVQDVQRETTAGFNKGRLIIEGLETFMNQRLLIEFQNENLVVLQLAEDGKTIVGDALACVPDLIMLVDADTCEPITTEEMKYGMRVAVVVLASHALLRTETALRFVGPQAFRYPDTVKFQPFADAKITKPIPPL
ncbi:uncharacterized protein LOC126831681 isoform X1 [Patella vulgata]|uniref:uncharacterized protein LOC126831681 isoform X1 n=1 Tax=Patella vulgata TaxID=6465 RepID=UPI0024A8077E|nr:uncharacterized protein LOC126831681 isoform X1 [Patella vulgata]